MILHHKGLRVTRNIIVINLYARFNDWIDLGIIVVLIGGDRIPGLGWQLPWPLWLRDGRGLEEVLFSPWRASSVVTERWPRMDQRRRREPWRGI